MIYFIYLEFWCCGIDDVFYGLNGGLFDKMWELDVCDLVNLNVVLKEKFYIELVFGVVWLISV